MITSLLIKSFLTWVCALSFASLQKSVDFTYAIIIDDDVPLPPDMHVPLLTLSRQEEIKVSLLPSLPLTVEISVAKLFVFCVPHISLCRTSFVLRLKTAISIHLSPCKMRSTS